MFKFNDNSYSVSGIGICSDNHVVVPAEYNGLPVTSISELNGGFTEITLPKTIISIGDEAFEYCYSLTSIEIPSSVTSIGYNAFYGCYRLVEVVNKSTHITVEKGSSDNGYVGYYALAVYNPGDTYTSKLSNENGYIIYTDGAEKILIGYNGTDTELVIPSGVEIPNLHPLKNNGAF